MIRVAQQKICLIIPYYGKWPKFFDLFLHSVSRNELLDVLFITDLEEKDSLNKNYRFECLSLAEFNDLASDKIGVPVNITQLYKLCDLKPAYGLIFNKYIEGYSHWAFGDIDVLYGQISMFMPKDWWVYDVLTFREEWLSGSLTILRNSEYVNNIFKQSASYEDCFCDEKHYGFDECWNLYSKLASKGSEAILLYDNKQSFTWVIKQNENLGNLNVYRERLIKESIPRYDYVLYRDGKVKQRNGKEFLFYHYITEKRTSVFLFPSWSSIPDSFFINRYGFFTESEFYSWKRYVIILMREFHGFAFFIKNMPSRLINKLARIFSIS